jgi:hypothetical protein
MGAHPNTLVGAHKPPPMRQGPASSTKRWQYLECTSALLLFLQWTKPIRDNKFAEIRKYLDIIPAAAAANCGYQRNLGHKMNREWAAATCRILQPHGMSDKCPPNWRHSKKAQYLWVLGQQLGLHVSLHSGLPRHAKRCG